MELVFKLIFLTSFVFAALFGFGVMMESQGHCLASLFQGKVCPKNLFGFASFHLGFFKNFSSAIFEDLGLFFFFLILGFLLVAAYGLGANAVGINSFFEKFTNEFTNPSPVKKIRSWLSLLLMSPPFLPAR